MTDGFYPFTEHLVTKLGMRTSETQSIKVLLFEQCEISVKVSSVGATLVLPIRLTLDGEICLSLSLVVDDAPPCG